MSLIDDELTTFRLWLQKQFTERCKKNARYSLRAFAKYLDLDASTLSQILSGKRKLSKKGIQRLCEKLGASPLELTRFGLADEKISTEDQYYQIGLDTFAVISDWYHYAILELTYTTGFKSDAVWISRKLSITVEEAKGAIERLLRLGLLSFENEKLIKSSKQITNNGLINTSGAHKELQKQIVSKAMNAIDECSNEEKDITSMTMAIDTKNLAKASLLIKKFRRDLCALLEEGEQTRVYNVGIQLYPVSQSLENIC
jgi:transcriptional regulator with XRE-family HTH domain